uniref:LD44824p n=2 Tax=Drosophila melanogaster TaxID=7227 RepID=Q7K1T1_DROME|eukprot:NP_001163056.1 vulcan, isoform E [Drosophila melanogaster]
MDRSLDSIGSCSLDVDADSSDISDTSGSLNFPTPVSVRDITREFTANLRERCVPNLPPQPQHKTPAYVESRSSELEHMVLSPAIVECDQEPSSNDFDETSAENSQEAPEKKPSYLNLACCVNGYSNLTTYDSKIRQDINKSREVSPIRPSTSSLQYCKRNHFLATPTLHSMPSPATKCKPIEPNNNSNDSSGNFSSGSGHSNGNGSFIKQRVERLYGPGALAQGFYSPKKHGQSPSNAAGRSERGQVEIDSLQGSELARKFKQLSPSKDYGEFRKKMQKKCSQSTTARIDEPLHSPGLNGDLDLPVFRHLSQEFRAQLPTVSPKRGAPRSCMAPDVLLVDNESSPDHGPTDEVDHESTKMDKLASEEYISTSNISVEAVVKDGNFFLKILKEEQSRLLVLAALAEKYADALSTNPDISEDTFGLLRSASGKARLLVSQKMKQFEGLCHNNLNRSPEDKFPTTLDDLQGFWDMVYLQVEHVDSIFADIEKLKSNDWKVKAQSVADQPDLHTIPTKTIKPSKVGVSQVKTVGKASSVRVNGSAPPPPNSAAALKREAQRKLLLEMKRQRREAMTAAAKLNPINVDADPDVPGIIGDSCANPSVSNGS